MNKKELIKSEIKFLQILCMSGGINKVAMDKVFQRIEELKKCNSELQNVTEEKK